MKHTSVADGPIRFTSRPGCNSCNRCSGTGTRGYWAEATKGMTLDFNESAFQVHVTEEPKTGMRYYQWSVNCCACDHGKAMAIPLTELIPGMRQDSGLARPGEVICRSL
jgi:hypothetical protein